MSPNHQLFMVPGRRATDAAYLIDRRGVKRTPATPHPQHKSISHAFYTLGLSTRRIAARTGLKPSEIECVIRQAYRREMGVGSIGVAA